MRLLVIGAAGQTGQLIIAKALGHGHEVTALVHQRALSVQHPRLRAVQGDVRDAASVHGVMAGHDAVAFALSTRSHDAGIHEAGIANVIYAMAETGASRLAALSAAGAFDRASSRLSLGQRVLMATVLRNAYDDLEGMERRIMASDLSWTIVRPSGLSNDPPSGHYRVSLDGSLLPKSRPAPRGDVAALVVKALETDTYWRRAVIVEIRTATHSARPARKRAGGTRRGQRPREVR